MLDTRQSVEKKKDFIFAVSVIIFCLIMYAETFNFPPPSKFHTFAPSAYPRMLIYTMLVLAGILLLISAIKALRTGGFGFSYQGLKDGLREKRIIMAVFGLFGVYLVLMSVLGFIIAAFLFLVICQWLLRKNGQTGWAKIILISVMAALITNYVFKLVLHVYLPRISL